MTERHFVEIWIKGVKRSELGAYGAILECKGKDVPLYGVCKSGEVPPIEKSQTDSGQITFGIESLEERELLDKYELERCEISDTRAALFGAVVALERLTKPCIVSLWTDMGNIYQFWLEGWVHKWFEKGKKNKKHLDLWERFIIQSERHELEIIPWKNKEADKKYIHCCELINKALQEKIT